MQELRFHDADFSDYVKFRRYAQQNPGKILQKTVENKDNMCYNRLSG